MPSSITHQLIAEESLKLLPEDIQAVAERNPDEFFLGAQGPDVFFFYRVLNRGEYNLGKFMHRYRVFEVFSFFLSCLREDGPLRLSPAAREKVLAYILGYITHYCADTSFHPFVYRYLEEHGCEKRVHQQMENDWDVYFLREKKERSVEKYDFPFSSKEIVRDGTIARVYALLCRKMEREDMEKSKFDAAIKNFDRYLQFFHDKCYSAQRGFEGAEKFFHAKPFLGALFPRENPEPQYLFSDEFETLSEGRGKNADELFDRAVSKSVELMKSFLACADEGLPLPKEEFSDGLLTGKPLDE